MSSIPQIESGSGRIVVCSHGSVAVFSELSSAYPLKLLSPRIDLQGVAVVYLLTYGGGLVGGDRVSVSVDTGPSAALVLLSQGSTKVFKTRSFNRAARPQGSEASPVLRTITSQAIDVRISENSALYLLPDPVTCFRSASYNQIQTFRLSRDASLVLLDWITSGRIALGEEWAFSRYYSANHVWVEGKMIVKDVMLLEDPTLLEPPPLAPRTLMDRLSPYSCYATLILYGPKVKSTILTLTKMYEGITVFKTTSPELLIWSISPISGGDGCIVRVAGKESEIVRGWLRDALSDLKDVIGIDIYRKAFP